MPIGEINVRINGNNKSLDRAVAKSTSSLFKFSNLLKSTFAVAGVTSMFAFAKASSQTSIAVESNMIRVQEIFGDAAKSVEKFAKNNAKSLGMSESAAYQYAAVYGNLLSGYTKSFEENSRVSRAFLQSTAVISSKTGRSIQDVMERIRSGMLGNTEAIEDLGIQVNIKTLEMTSAFKRLAGDKSWEQLDAKLQQQIRALAILEQSNSKFGDQVLKSSVFSVNSFSAALDDLKATVGQFLNIAIVPGIEWITAFIQVVNDGIKSLFNLNRSLGASSVTSGIKGQVNAQEDLTDAVEDTAKAQNNLMSFDELNVLSDNKTSDANTGVTDGGSVFDDIQAPKDTFSAGVSEKYKAIKQFIDGIKENPAIKAIGNAFSFLWNNAIKPMGSWMIQNPDVVLKWIGGVAAAVGGYKIIKGVTRIINTFKNFGELTGVTKLFTKSAGKMGTTLKGTAKTGNIVADSFTAMRNNMSLMTKGLIGAGGAVAIFATVRSAVYDAETGTKSWSDALMGLIPVCALVGTALYAAFGPAGLIFGAIVGLGAAFIGVNDAQKQLAADIMDATFFSNIGIGVDDFTASVKASWDEIDTFNGRQQELQSQIEESDKQFDDSKAVIDTYMLKMQACGGQIAAEDIPKMQQAFDDLFVAINNSIGTRTDRIMAVFQQVVADATAEARPKIEALTSELLALQAALGKKASQLQSEINAILNRAQNGKLSAEDQSVLNKKIQELSKFSATVSPEQVRVQIAAENAGSLINFKDKETSIKAIDQLIADAEAAVESVRTNRDQQIADLRALATITENVFGEGIYNAQYKPMFDQAETEINKFATTQINEIYSNMGLAHKNIQDAFNKGFEDALSLAYKDGDNPFINEGKIVGEESQELRSRVHALYSFLQNVPQFASGGVFPRMGQLFVANERGPEMIGNFGSKSVVANNDQITEGISRGVYDAVVSAMGSNQAGSPVEMHLYLDGKEITYAVEKNQKERGKTLMPGGVAFGY